MNSKRPSTPKSPRKAPTRATNDAKPGHQRLRTEATDSKASEQVTTASQRSASESEPLAHDFHCSGQQAEVEREVAGLQARLMKEEEKNYIFKQFFRKIEKALYSEHSELLEQGQVRDYEKLQLHLADMVKRVEKGSHYSKLAAVPVIYKKNTTTTTVVHKTHKK
jgi:hypothetical protein